MENPTGQPEAQALAAAEPRVVRARKPKKEAKVAKAKKAPKAKAKKGDGIVRGALTLSKKYNKGTSNAGNVSYDSGDKLAQELRGVALEDVYDIAAKKLGVTVRSLKGQYGNLNPGMQRMNLGNRLRKLLREKAAKKAA